MYTILPMKKVEKTNEVMNSPHRIDPYDHSATLSECPV